jgi:hypothetical protein
MWLVFVRGNSGAREGRAGRFLRRPKARRQERD